MPLRRSSSGYAPIPGAADPPAMFTEKQRRIIFCACLFGAMVVIGAVVLGVELSQSSSPAPSSSPQFHNYRLSNTTVPALYALTIRPFINPAGPDNYWTGLVDITLNLSAPTDAVYLHSYKALTIHNCSLLRPNGSAVPLKGKCFNYDENEYLVVPLAVNVSAAYGYHLQISFQGAFSGAIIGFYRSTYNDSGSTNVVATTKFEPTFARRAFPCFDEPNKKARFRITLIHETFQPVAISNMPVKSTGNYAQSGWLKTEFQESVPMSTYLVCFIASDFSKITNTTEGNHSIPIAAYGPKGRIEQTRYALGIVKTVLPYYETFFGIDYPMPKMDIISIPDFVSGAMENWGVVTFRETNVLIKEGVSTILNRQRVAQVVAHELAHMWFGNLVTMDWWSDLWLNEGFADFTAFVKGLPFLEAGWDSDTQFVIDELEPVMVADAELSSHPIIQAVNRPDDINAAFDSITYDKGASVLRMLEAYLGAAKFRKGIKDYLNKYKFRNARTDQLWAQLKEASGKDVKAVMDTWTTQMGFPVVTADCAAKTLSQTRFLANPDVVAPAYSWQIPITYQPKGKSNITILLNTASVAIPEASDYDWTLVNVEQKGYFRVNYDATCWQRLSSQLKKDHSALPSANRASLVDDAWNLAGAGLLSYNVSLGLLGGYLDTEESHVPWAAASSALRYVAEMLQGQTYAPHFQAYVRSFASPALAGLGWATAGMSGARRLLLSTLIPLACANADATCLRNASVRFNAWIANASTPISPIYRNYVLRYGVQESTASIWETMWQRYLQAPVTEKSIYQAALAKTKNASILNEYIRRAWDTKNVRTQDYLSVLRYISGNPQGTQLVYDYVKTHWGALVTRFTLNDRYFGRLITYITSSFNTAAQLTDVKDFFAANKEAGAGAGPRKEIVKAALDRIRSNIAWLAANQYEIRVWLTANGFV